MIIGLVVIICGCTTASDRNEVGNTEIINPIDYGNGVLYFPCVESKFANSLSDYLLANPSLRVDAISGDGTGGYGYDLGYFVVIEKR